MYTKKLLFSLLVITAASTASFSSVKNSGHIISENPSVRGAGMGYAYTANTSGDAFGFFSNPSYIPSSPMIGLSYSMLYKEGESVSEGAAGAFSFLYPNLFWGVNIGIAAVSSLEGNIENEQDSAVYLNLSKQIKFLRFGVNTKYINSKYYRDSDSDIVTADAGLSATFKNFTFGIAGHNLFGDFKDIDSHEKINPSLSAGAAIDLTIRNFMFTFEFGGIQRDLNKNDINPRAGLEVFYKIASLRGGYEYDDTLEDKGTLFAGIGLEIKNIIFDYAFIADQNNSEAGDMHKMALSYKFPPIVKNEQYRQQVEYEKQQAKLEKKARRKKENKQAKQNEKSSGVLSKKSSKENVLPLQPVKNTDYADEFFAVLTPADSAGSDQPANMIQFTKDEEKKAVDKLEEAKKNDYADPALYLLELEQNKKIKPGPEQNEVKTASYDSTPHKSGDYDAAQELLSDSKQQKKSKEKMRKKKMKQAKSQGPPKPDFKVTSKERMRQAELDAKAERAKKVYLAVEDGEFDAARYVLENPGKHKIKYQYVKPTKTSKKDFDAANYLIQKEKRENP